jgi:hypothetical protein
VLEKLACAQCVLQVHHIVLLFTPLTLPEKKTFGSLAACVDVDLVLLSFIESQRRRPSPQRKKAKFSNTGNPPPCTGITRPEGVLRGGEERARASSGTRRRDPNPLWARCVLAHLRPNPIDPPATDPPHTCTHPVSPAMAPYN